MKNKPFFYLQYDKINWENQEKTKINYSVNQFIIEHIILKNKNKSIQLFDIGFGIGFFIEMVYNRLKDQYQEIHIEGCEPSIKNYDYFKKKVSHRIKNVSINALNSPFQEINLDRKFDFITAIYVFPHFESEDLDKIAKKINSLLDEKGKFILVVAQENYLKQKLSTKKDLFIEENIIQFKGKRYKEVLHYSDIPNIGKVIDYNREESFYIDLFKEHNFKLSKKEDLNDKGFICTIFTFEKNKGNL